MLEYEVYYKLSKEYCIRNQVGSPTSKILVKVKNESQVKMIAYDRIGSITGASSNDIIIEDIILWDEYDD